MIVPTPSPTGLSCHGNISTGPRLAPTTDDGGAQNRRVELRIIEH
jgi:outer membrane protein OmpA-like peptidoglycan-associated protein